jgi:tetratricopeptide (TPR) repeat protein
MSTPRAAVIAVVLLFASQTRAEDNGAQLEAKARFRAGATYFEAAAYDRAIVEFEASYKLAPMPETLFTIAQSYRLKGDRRKAVEYYQRYLDGRPNGRGSPEARNFIDGLEDELVSEREKEAKRQAQLAAQQQSALDAKRQALAAQPAIVAAPSPPPKKPLVKQWWVWTIVGVVVVGAGLGVGLGLGLQTPGAPAVQTTDGTFRWRGTP